MRKKNHILIDLNVKFGLATAVHLLKGSRERSNAINYLDRKTDVLGVQMFHTIVEIGLIADCGNEYSSILDWLAPFRHD
jgi:hypothetical protein